ncbi:MAG: diguanylate cyclase [Potamolinea sp.]
MEQPEQIVEQQLRRQTQALMALARSKKIDSGDLKAALKEITEVSASVLDVERASIWIYYTNSPSLTIPFWFSSKISDCPKRTSVADRSLLQCLDLYEQSLRSHKEGMELSAANYPAYFQALATESMIAADDAHTEPQTREFSESYLTPNGITSVLDAPIWLNDQMVGIVCIEHTGTRRQWSLIEKNFVEAITYEVALTIEAYNRVLNQKQLKQQHPHISLENNEELNQLVSLLKDTINCIADGIVAVSITGEVISYNQKFVELWNVPEEIVRSCNHQERLRFFQEQLKEPEFFLNRTREFHAQPEMAGYDLIEMKDGRTLERVSQPQRNGQEIIGRVWTFRDITERVQVEIALRKHLQQEQLIAVMRDRIRQSLNLEEILNTTAEEVRQFLQTDRVLIYRFDPDWNGTVVVESVASEYMTILGMAIHDPCFGETYVQQYQRGRIQAVTDIHTARLAPCHFNLLAQLQVRSNLVVPILQGVSRQERGVSPLPHPPNTSLPALWGLLIAHHCSEPRQWQELEVDLLKSLATQVAIAIQQSSLFEQLEAANQELERLACVDGLTQVANRRRFDEYLNAEWRRLAREQKPLSLILCDLDYFKFYNDTYGHLGGDLCLQQVAEVLRQTLKRPADLVARYGGEEFAVILPNTDAKGALIVAEAIREGVRGLEIPHLKSPVSQFVTLSLGVASFVPSPDSIPAQLIGVADKALYQAKADGRDCIAYGNP